MLRIQLKLNHEQFKSIVSLNKPIINKTLRIIKVAPKTIIFQNKTNQNKNALETHNQISFNQFKLIKHKPQQSSNTFL